ncbi:GNAT family N-acetyltransferase [Vibrio sp. 10N.261.51.F12]|uniref:GNAT family N-acetyltransferase n=1 Tax=Vibrio sp. 10N.261.51.F12 TaxID=3229679 RepID=UPI0035532DF6
MEIEAEKGSKPSIGMEVCSLHPFTSNDYPLLIDWINTDTLNYQWSGPQFTFPLTHRQLTEHYRNQAAQPFLFHVNGRKVGFVELVRVDNDTLRICRVFIHPDFQGQGFAFRMLKRLLALATSKNERSDITLSVFSHNRSAIHCYQKLGFVRTDIVRNTKFVEGRYWDLWLMSLKRTS